MHALLIETSTERGMIALVKDRQVSFCQELSFGYNQSKFLMPELQSIVRSFHLGPDYLDCIGVGIGPGSYTGIRIGVAVAKSLSYVWKLPLVGVPSLHAFIPSTFQEGENFAGVIDAKISGVYFIKGRIVNGTVVYQSDLQVCPLNHLQEQLRETKRLVTPYSKSLSVKLASLYPEAAWEWEERGPAVQQVASLVEEKYAKGECSLDGRLELLYMRKTEAEIGKEKHGQKN